ncbi:MAG: site-2 protease family protein [Clostridia bacterium]|nr:site-2 protease family protein [Clostridia bacterium]
MLLASSSTWNIIWSLLVAIAVLLVMITVHEAGHFAAGKILGFTVEEFAVGFGPAVLKIKNRTSGLFSLRLIPLGGYCSFYDGEDRAENKKKVKDAESGSEPEAASFDEAGGENGASSRAERAAEAERGSLAAAAVAAYSDIAPWRRIILLFSGVFVNYILSIIIIIVMFLACGRCCYCVESAEPLIPGNEAFAENVLKDGDIIVKAEGKNIFVATDLVSVLDGKKAGDWVRFTVIDAGGETVERSVFLYSDCDIANSTELYKMWDALGINELGSAYWRMGAGLSIGQSFSYSYRLAGAMFKLVGELLTGKLGFASLEGPSTISDISGGNAVESWAGFLMVCAYLGVNLAVFNLLPIPSLDGSGIVFCVIEWISKKKLPRKAEYIINTVGFILVIGLAVLIDILAFV